MDQLNIADVNAHLTALRDLNSTEALALQTFLDNPLRQRVLKKFLQHKNQNFNIGLNIFTLISGQYKKENFHSDIIRELLDPNGLHGEGAKFLQLFLNFLSNHPKRPCIRNENYSNAVVHREAGRIDISIKDETTMRAIIIENKINNASDTYRQIPKYHKLLLDKGYTIDAVVYLVLSGNKQPSTVDWTEQERDVILKKTLPVEAYTEQRDDLYFGWLKKCEDQARDIDAIFLLRHYTKLIYGLGAKNMNKPLMETFLQNMLAADNYKTANALKDMLDSLIFYRRDKVIDRYKYDSSPFTKVYDWNHFAVISDYFQNDENLVIDVVVQKDGYLVQFFGRGFINLSGVDGIVNPVVPILEELGLSGEFHSLDRRMEKQFSFPGQEQEFYGFLDTFIAALRNLENKVRDKP